MTEKRPVLIVQTEQQLQDVYGTSINKMIHDDLIDVVYLHAYTKNNRLRKLENINTPTTNAEESTMAQQHPLHDVHVIYQDSNGVLHSQPLADIDEVGTLIDPDTGDDLEMIATVVSDTKLMTDPDTQQKMDQITRVIENYIEGQ